MTTHDKPHINGHDATSIMKDPAAAAGAQPDAPAPFLQAPPDMADPGVQRLLRELPGLVGALDAAIKDTAGKPHPFMLMIFTPGFGLHATNADPQQVQAAAADMVKGWDTTPPEKIGGDDASSAAAANEG